MSMRESALNDVFWVIRAFPISGSYIAHSGFCEIDLSQARQFMCLDDAQTLCNRLNKVCAQFNGGRAGFDVIDSVQFMIESVLHS